MRFGPLEAALAAVTVVLAAGTYFQHAYCSGLETSEYPPQKSAVEEPRNKTQTYDSQPTGVPLFTATGRATVLIDAPLLHQENTYREAEQPKHAELGWSDRFLCEAKATDVALVWFTLLLGVVTALLVWSARDQDTGTKAIERAYVKMSHVEDGFEWRKGEFENSFRLTLRIENFGNTPAKITDVLLKPAVCALTGLPDAPDYSRPRSVSEFHAFLVRGEHFFYDNPEMLMLSAESKKEILNGRKLLYVVGYVDYEDVFGVQHRGGYARRFTPSDEKFVLITEPGYNYDEERS